MLPKKEKFVSYPNKASGAINSTFVKVLSQLYCTDQSSILSHVQHAWTCMQKTVIYHLFSGWAVELVTGLRELSVCRVWFQALLGVQRKMLQGSGSPDRQLPHGVSSDCHWSLRQQDIGDRHKGLLLVNICIFCKYKEEGTLTLV